MPYRLEVEGVDFEAFRPRFKKLWTPGQHLAIEAPTGEGKTTLAYWLLSGRRYVLALDQKGGDETIGQYPGFRRTHTWPDRQARRDLDDDKPVRLIIGRVANVIEDLDRNVELQARVLNSAWQEKGWTMYVPDLQLLTDRRLGNLSAQLDKFLIAARDRKISVVTDFQELTNISKLAYRMASWFAIGYTRDRDTVERVSEATGRSFAEMRGLVRELPEHHFLFVPKRPRDPILVTLPDPLPRPREGATSAR